MPEEIWSEGRVVGESAYNIYVKQHLAVDPNTPPATEREWLASSIANGSSLLLKVPPLAGRVKQDTFRDIQLPHNSNLAAANTIVASFFDGDAHFPDGDTDHPDDAFWADRITDYGQLISNTSSSSPNGIVTEVDDETKLPTQSISTWTSAKQKQLVQYMNIIDGIVIQPGNWISATNQPPEKDFIPNLANTHPRVRLHMRGETDSCPLILLTGFTMNSVLNGITGDEGSTNTNHPENGDFLGPEDFPWVSKIVFSVPNSYINYMVERNYTRQLKEPYGESSGTPSIHKVDATPYIDMDAQNPKVYYTSYNDGYYSMYTTRTDSPQVSYGVNSNSTTDPNSAVLTVYQKRAVYPPALYATLVTETGPEYLNPLDIVAPGSVKMFYNRDMSDPTSNRLLHYESTFPGTHAFNLTSSGKIQYVFNNQVVTLADSSDIPSTSLSIGYLTNSGNNFSYPYPNSDSSFSTLTGTNRPKLLRTYTTDGKSEYSLMMSNDTSISTSPTMRTVNANPAVGVILNHTNSGDNITWSALLAGLSKDKSIDLLGDRLKETKYSLIKRESYSSAPSASEYTHENVYDSSKGLSYIPFGNDSDPKRLYILSGSDIMDTMNDSMGSSGDDFSGGPDPTNIPAGSIAIGLGWHSIYRLITQGNGVKSWTPSYGAEFDCGNISGNDGSVEPDNYVRRSFLYGLIIVGRGEVGDGRSISDSDVGKYYNTEISTYSASSSNHLFVAFVDNWSRVHILSQSDDSNIQVTLRYKVTKNEISGDLTKIPTLIRIQNNSYGPTRYSMQWMLIGQLTHRRV